MTAADQVEIARRRQELADAMDDELYGIHKRTQSSRKRVGPPARTANGALGKRTTGAKRNYRKTAPATARTTEIWGNRVA